MSRSFLEDIDDSISKEFDGARSFILQPHASESDRDAVIYWAKLMLEYGDRPNLARLILNKYE